MAKILDEHDAAVLVVYGRRGSTAVPWLTGWHVTTEAVALLTDDEPIHLLVQLYNHVPNARRMASDCLVGWAGPDTLRRLATDAAARTARGARIGWIGELPHRAVALLAGEHRAVVDLSAAYERARLVKSAEELQWMRTGSALTDRSLAALLRAARVGATELELAAAVEQSYLAEGGTNHLHFFASTPMTEPDRCVPAQWPSSRRLDQGDVLVTELSTSYWGYPGQLLRTIAVAAEPTGLYEELHEVASRTFGAVATRIRAGAHAEDLVAAADIVEDAGFTIYDDLLHGFGGGYLPPVLRTRATQLEAVPDVRLEAGMTIVLQPNIVTKDERAGVQTGELLHVTDTGYESLHGAPRGFLRATGA